MPLCIIKKGRREARVQTIKDSGVLQHTGIFFYAMAEFNGILPIYGVSDMQDSVTGTSTERAVSPRRMSNTMVSPGSARKRKSRS